MTSIDGYSPGYNMSILYHSSNLYPISQIRRLGYFSTLPVRGFNNPEPLAENALSQLDKDWAKYVTEGSHGRKRQKQGDYTTPIGCALRFYYPEVASEKMELLAVLLSIMIRHDDNLEALPANEAVNLSHADYGLYAPSSGKPNLISSAIEALEALDFQLSDLQPVIVPKLSADSTESETFYLPGSICAIIENVHADPAIPMHKILAPWLKRVIAIDAELGLELLKAVRWQYKAQDTKMIQDFDTVEKYAKYRCVDVAARICEASIRFGEGIHLDRSQISSIAHLDTLIWEIAGVTNDYWSWPKEKIAYQNGERVMSAVIVAMQQYGLTDVEALEFVRKWLLEREKVFVRACEDWLQEERPEALRKYLDAMVLFAGGAHLYECCGPRYNSHRMERVAESVREAGVMCLPVPQS